MAPVVGGTDENKEGGGGQLAPPAAAGVAVAVGTAVAASGTGEGCGVTTFPSISRLSFKSLRRLPLRLTLMSTALPPLPPLSLLRRTESLAPLPPLSLLLTTESLSPLPPLSLFFRTEAEAEALPPVGLLTASVTCACFDDCSNNPFAFTAEISPRLTISIKLAAVTVGLDNPLSLLSTLSKEGR
jgi:hypothetical protein